MTTIELDYQEERWCATKDGSVKITKETENNNGWFDTTHHFEVTHEGSITEYFSLTQMQLETVIKALKVISPEFM